MTPDLDALLGRWQRNLFGLALIAGLGVVVGALLNLPQFFRSWLMSWLFCLSIPLGCLSLEMLQYMTGGRWGISVERILEAAARTLPVVALLFIPVLLGMNMLY